MNPKASDVAIELRKLADALDREPDAEIPRPSIYFCCSYQGAKGKPLFLNLAHSLPRPLNKVFGTSDVHLKYDSESFVIDAYVERSQICEIIEPAKPAVYNCIPLLSEEEEAALGVF